MEDPSIIVGNAIRALPIIVTVIGAGLTIAVIRYYWAIKPRPRGLLRPAMIMPVLIALLLIDVLVVQGQIARMGTPFEWRLLVTTVAMAIPIYPLALVIYIKPKVPYPAPRDEIDLIHMLTERQIERDRTIKIGFATIALMMVITITMMLYFTFVNFTRMYQVMQENRALLEQVGNHLNL